MRNQKYLSEFVDLNIYSDNSKKITWNFEQLTNYYQKINKICRSYYLGLNYIQKNHQVTEVDCDKFNCPICRKKLKYRLKQKIEKAVNENRLTKHIVITTEGEEYRMYHDYIESYNDIQKAWNKIRTRLNQKLKTKLNYICMVRAQKSGYAHIHLLTNNDITENKLKNITKKYKNLGFIAIRERENITNYLTNHFLKDNEFYIPIGKRHYSTSRNIKINIYEEENITDNTLHININPKAAIDNNEYIINKLHQQIYNMPIQINKNIITANYQTVPYEYIIKHYIRKTYNLEKGAEWGGQSRPLINNNWITITKIKNNKNSDKKYNLINII